MGFWSSIFGEPAKPAKHRQPRSGHQKAATARTTRGVGVAKAPPGSLAQRPSRGRVRAASGTRVTPADDRGAPVRQSPRARFAGASTDQLADARIRHTQGTQRAAGLRTNMGQPGKATQRQPATFPWWRPISTPTVRAVGRAPRPAAGLPRYPQQVSPERRNPPLAGAQFYGPVRPGDRG